MEFDQQKIFGLAGAKGSEGKKLKGMLRPDHEAPCMER